MFQKKRFATVSHIKVYSYPSIFCTISIMNTVIQDIINNAIQTHQRLALDPKVMEQVQALGTACTQALQNNNKIILCGNGGSFADAQHIAAEFVGRFIKERHSLPSIALGCNASSTTAIGNDYSFDEIFSREFSSLGQPGDVLIGITTSGNSPNVLAAIDVALEKNIQAFGLTSNKKGAITKKCPCIEIPSDQTPRVQECHILVGHIICEMIDAAIIK
jgi:D-sedoheptulose 7-phosphate isomerase